MKKYLTIHIVLISFLLLGSCSDNKNSNPIVSNYPENGADKVSVITNVTVKFADHVDSENIQAGDITLVYKSDQLTKGFVPATINHDAFVAQHCSFCHADTAQDQDSVRAWSGMTKWPYITDKQEYTVKGAISFDPASRMIMFKPDSPLEYAAEYELVFNNIADASGKPLNIEPVVFRTYENPTTFSLTLNPVENTKQVTKHLYDIPDGITRHVNYSSPGQDETWQTDDDVINSYYADILAANGLHDKIVGYSAPSADGIWFTNDDVVKNYRQFMFNDQGKLDRVVFYNSAGPDNTWFTNDDELLSYERYKYDTSGRFIATLQYTEPGQDNTWFTADDVIDSGYTKQQYEDTNKKNYAISYINAGTDGLWDTSDDEIQSYIKTVLNDTNQSQTKITYTQTGDDDTWLTDDDVIDHYTKYEYTDQGEQTHSIFYSSPGDDGSWLTSDYGINHYTKTVNNSNTTLNIRYTRSGDDGIWLTDDDEIDLYQSFEYSVDRQISSIKTYRSWGEDGIWLTPDDLISGYATYIYDDEGNHLQVIGSLDPGPDDDWFTEDDVKQKENLYDTSR